MNHVTTIIPLDEYMTCLKDVQDIQVEILSEFHNFCEANNLTYVLTWGSLLGAVRHNGFIPWDDDIDICMPRQDYEKFLDIKSEFDENFFIQNFTIDNSFYPFTKIRKNNTEMIMKSSESGAFHQGIWIDIFPMDQMPKDHQSFEFKFRYYRIVNLIGIVTSSELSKAQSAGNVFNKLLRYFYYIINKIFKNKYFVRKLDKALKKDYDNRDELFDLTNANPKDFKKLFSIRKQDFYNKKLHSFEGYQFYIPDNSEYYLSKLYDNYLEYPPSHQQFPHHKVTKLKY